jgi:hypothetical protein
MPLLPILSFAMLAMLLMNMLAKTRPYSKTNLTGKTLKVMPLSLLSRVWVHRFGLSAMITGLALVYLTGWLPTSLIGMMAAFALVIVLMPMKLTLTSQGLALGESTSLHWNEIKQLKIKKSSLELEQSSFLRRIKLFLKPGDKEQIAQLIVHHIPAALPNA